MTAWFLTVFNWDAVGTGGAESGPLAYFLPERGEGEPGQAEVHASEGYADDGDVEEEAEEDVGEPDPDASDEEPQDVHEHVQTAGLGVLACDVGSEGP